jgi:hypothetical protein
MTSSSEPRSFEDLAGAWGDVGFRQSRIDAFISGRESFIVDLLPERAIRLSAEETLDILAHRLGHDTVATALGPDATDPERPSPIPSPVAGHADAAWLRRANLVGINVRTTGTFFGALKYTLTLPAAQDSVHFLPIWEPGVVESLYGPCSWELNDEFIDPELAGVRPHLDTTARQLRAVINLLHAAGRTVGMDVIPHTDRYSQMSLAYPAHFEWLRRDGLTIADHRADLHEEVERELRAFLAEEGPALTGDPVPEDPFGDDVDEARRLQLLFGRPEDGEGREARRVAVVKRLHALGYEPLPATMGPPYRGLEVDGAFTTDAHGLVWHDYRITEPEEFSRAFGPLARYKLYERVDDNRAWQVDFSRPREAVWRYVCQRYAEVQRRFGFDYMRGDMSHVQMRPGGVPDVIDERYDLLRAVKRHIQREGTPSFGYFAESFLAPPGVMAYGDEVDHLEASEAEATLGNLQSMPVGTAEFLRELRRYLDLLATRSVAPAFTVITADKDDPRFDSFYIKGNALRLFLALFVPDMPSYTGLGFETRDVHLEPAPNEHYTKLYVFREPSGPKSTSGPYVWGRNADLFRKVTRLRRASDAVLPAIRDRATRWLLPPDPTAGTRLLCWTQQGERPAYLFVVNADLGAPAANVGIPLHPADGSPVLELTTADHASLAPADRKLRENGYHYKLASIEPAECRIYRLG